MSDLIRKASTEIPFNAETLEFIKREITHVREEFADNKYIREAILVLNAGGLRSTIGCYWNAVIDDLRRKVMHRSLDLFNKEMDKKVKSYEDFQNNVTDYDLIEGAYKIGVLSWEEKKIMHQARETRNIYDGHPDSKDPGLIKVLSLIADCNNYVLSQAYPIPIINVNDYLAKMDTDTYDKHDLAVEQAFIDLPEIYKSELANKLFTYYAGDTISTRFRGNIEFTFPILWRVLPKESRKQLGLRFDKTYLEADSDKNEKSIKLLSKVDGLRYTSTTTRRLIFEPQISNLETSLDNWSDEARIVKELYGYGSVVPDDLIPRLVTAITLTFVGYKGSSYSYHRTEFFSDAAAANITKMFEKFDNNSASEFINAIKSNSKLKSRIKGTGQLKRLRTLSEILLNKPEITGDSKSFLELLVDETKTKDFYYEIEK